MLRTQRGRACVCYWIRPPPRTRNISQPRFLRTLKRWECASTPLCGLECVKACTWAIRAWTSMRPPRRARPPVPPMEALRERTLAVRDDGARTPVAGRELARRRAPRVAGHPVGKSRCGLARKGAEVAARGGGGEAWPCPVFGGGPRADGCTQPPWALWRALCAWGFQAGPQSRPAFSSHFAARVLHRTLHDDRCGCGCG